MKASLVLIPKERRCKASLTYFEGGQQQTEEVTIIYRPMSAATQREFISEVVGTDGKYQFADYVARFVVAIPEIVDDAGNPVAITPEFVGQLSVENVTAIHNAIEADQNPNPLPPAP